MLGTGARYYVAYVVYNGATDAERYNLASVSTRAGGRFLRIHL